LSVVLTSQPRHRRRHVEQAPGHMAAALITVLLWACAFVGDPLGRGGALTRGDGLRGGLLVGSASLGLFALRYRRPFPARAALAFVIGYGVLWFAGYNGGAQTGPNGTWTPAPAALLVNIAPILVAGGRRHRVPRRLPAAGHHRHARRLRRGRRHHRRWHPEAGRWTRFGIVLGVLTASSTRGGADAKGRAALGRRGHRDVGGLRRRAGSDAAVRPRAAGELADASGGAIAGVVSSASGHRDRLHTWRTPSRTAPGAWRRRRCASRVLAVCCPG